MSPTLFYPKALIIKAAIKVYWILKKSYFQKTTTLRRNEMKIINEAIVLGKSQINIWVKTI